MGVTSEGLSYAETQMKNYRHLASLGSPYHVAAILMASLNPFARSLPIWPRVVASHP